MKAGQKTMQEKQMRMNNATLAIPVFESYVKIQNEAIEDCRYINENITKQVRPYITPTFGILIDAAENPGRYNLKDVNNMTAKPRMIKWKNLMAFNNGIMYFDRATFESWYHTFNEDGIARRLFFEELSSEEIKVIQYYDFN